MTKNNGFKFGEKVLAVYGGQILEGIICGAQKETASIYQWRYEIDTKAGVIWVHSSEIYHTLDEIKEDLSSWVVHYGD